METPIGSLLGAQGVPLSGDIERDLQAQIDFFEQQGNKNVADSFRGIQNERSSLFNGFRDNLLNYYDEFENLRNPVFDEFIRTNNARAAEILPELEQREKFVREEFGPNGRQINSANEYFRQLIADATRESSARIGGARRNAFAAGQGSAGASAAALRARQDGLSTINDIRGRQFDQQNALYNSYLELLGGIRDKRFTRENELIANPLIQLQNQINSLGNNIITGLSSIDNNDIDKINADLANQRAIDLANGTSTITGTGTNTTTGSGRIIGEPVDASVVTTSNADGSFSDEDGNTYAQIDGQFFQVVSGSLLPQIGRSAITSGPGNIQSTHGYGLDIGGAGKENTPVPSAVTGSVIDVGNDANGFGLYVIVEDAQGNRHRFSHLNRQDVRVGDRLTRGQSVGLLGNTGRSTGPHLDYTVYTREKTGERSQDGLPLRSTRHGWETGPEVPLAYINGSGNSNQNNTQTQQVQTPTTLPETGSNPQQTQDVDVDAILNETLGETVTTQSNVNQNLLPGSSQNQNTNSDIINQLETITRNRPSTLRPPTNLETARTQNIIGAIRNIDSSINRNNQEIAALEKEITDGNYSLGSNIYRYNKGRIDRIKRRNIELNNLASRNLTSLSDTLNR